MITNYYLAMTNQCKEVTEQDKLLLHTCCAPCLSGTITQLTPFFKQITIYYSNDNITDIAEWQKRLDEVQKLVDLVSSGNYENAKCTLTLVVKPFEPCLFFDKCKCYASEPEGGLRCNNCIEMRLVDSYNYASNNGYSYYTSTLTISPHKNAKFINECGSLHQNDTTKWLFSDFKKKDGYKNSVTLSNKYSIYRQHYCGCNYSKNDSNN